MKKHIIDEQNGLTYTLVGDYYFPDFAIEIEKDLKEISRQISSLGKYGRMRNDYLRKNKIHEYNEMICNGTLIEHLKDTDDSAFYILEQTVKAFAEADGCDEILKATDQIKWIGLMNNYRHCAEEIIFKELIYI